MAFIVKPGHTCHGDRTFRSVVVVETEVGVAATWEVSGLPLYFTITLFEAMIESVPGAATTIDPELRALWDGESQILIGDNEDAAALVRTGCDLRVTAPDGKLYGKSVPNGTAVRIVTRITYREGH